MSRFAYAKYDIELEDSPIDVVVPDGDASGSPLFRNWHRQLVTAPRALQRISRLLREELGTPTMR